MNVPRHPLRLAAGLAAALLVATAIAGCDKKLRTLIIPNQLPEVRITSAPIDLNATCDPDPVRSCYALTLNWVGHDPDGRVDRYLYAVDPPSEANSDTVWQTTEDNETRIILTAELPDNPVRPGTIFEEPHVFVLRAVDNRGGVGPITYRAFFSFTEAPSVRILNPRPSRLSTPLVPPSMRITWSGNDPDGVLTDKPVRYRYILLGDDQGALRDEAKGNPDTLRTLYAPDFEGWHEVGGDTTEVQFTNLNPNQNYVFAVVAFDEAGAYSPVFSLDSNMLQFKVGFAGVQGPRITFFNASLNYTYSTASYCPCPEVEVFVELPADRRVTMNWLADPPQGATIAGYRWMVDGDVSDTTQRVNQDDISHWSLSNTNTTSVRLGPWPGGEEHRLYVEAEDNNGLKSLGIIRFVVVASSLEKPLLVVDDMRLTADSMLPTGCVRTPQGPWPTAAELDTFFFARGGVPWQCYSPAVNSTPGIFAGYKWDSLGTRYHLADMSTRLSTLGNYAHVIWMTDLLSATYAGAGTDRSKPITSLRYMTARNRVNTLGSYVSQGGKVWMLGGGVAFASNIAWDDANNNSNPTGTNFKSSGANRELAEGRFMFDLPHWQSAINATNAVATVYKHLGRYQRQTDGANPWTMHRHELLDLLDHRRNSRPGSPADPIPPYRNSGSFYSNGSVPIEHLFEENFVIEDLDEGDGFNEQSTLDTLYMVAPNSPRDTIPVRPIMTYYHGLSVPQGFIFSGFAPWNFKRAHCQALFDFVLTRIWSIPRTAPALRATRTVPVESLKRPVEVRPGSLRRPRASLGGRSSGPGR